MNRKLAKGVFFLVEKLRREPVFECLRELEKNQWLTRRQIADLQWEALTLLLKHAYANVPYYRNLFDRLGIRISDIKSREDFHRIPILTKKCLRKNVRQMLAMNRKERLYSANTSGSTGLPLVFYRDGRSTGYSLAAMFRGHTWYGLEIGAKGAMLWDVPIKWKARVSTRLKDFLLNSFREKECNLYDENFFHFYRMMKKKRPDYLMGYPSITYPFAFFLRENGIDGRMFELKMVKCTSETLFDYHRELIESVFGCRLASEYGSAEMGVIAFECPEGGFHLMADCVYTEFLDEFGRPARPGMKARIIVTNLRNYSMPILRYEMGDIGVASGGMCECGRGLPLMESVVGRVSEPLITADGKKAHAGIFYHVIHRLNREGLAFKQYKVYQTAVSELKIEIIKGPDFSERLLKNMDRELHQSLGSGMNIHYEFVSDIPRDRSGKLRDFVSLLSSD